MCTVASGRPKRLWEGLLMLVRGLDSVAASLAQLSDTLTAAHKATMDSTGGSFLPSHS